MQVYLDFGVYYEGMGDLEREDEREKYEEQLNSTISSIQVTGYEGNSSWKKKMYFKIDQVYVKIT